MGKVCRARGTVEIDLECLNKQIDGFEKIEKRDEMDEGMLQMAYFARGLLLTGKESWGKGEDDACR